MPFPSIKIQFGKVNFFKDTKEGWFHVLASGFDFVLGSFVLVFFGMKD